MRQLIIQVPRGNGTAVIDIAKSHNGVNLARFEGNADEAIDVVIVHVSNREVGKVLEELQDLPKVHITLIPTSVMALQPPTSEAPQQVVDVEERSPIEIFLSGLQSVGSWRGFLSYAALAGFVVWIGLYTNTAYLLVAAMLIAPFAGPAMNTAIAPQKISYIKSNWLTAISLILPALRTFRIIRVVRILRTARAVRGLQLLRVMTRANQGMRVLGASISRRGFGYVVALTAIVTVVGAAGMYTFENEVPVESGLHNYSTAFWWTAMLMTTMGSDYSPKTPEGRVLCFFLALYAFAVFGYVTATLATFFIGRDADDDQAELAGAKSIQMLQSEITALRGEIQELLHQNSQR